MLLARPLPPLFHPPSFSLRVRAKLHVKVGSLAPLSFTSRTLLLESCILIVRHNMSGRRRRGVKNGSVFSEHSLAGLKFGYISTVINQSLGELEWRRKTLSKIHSRNDKKASA